VANKLNLKPDVRVFGINTKHKETLSITAYELNKTDIGNSFVTEVISKWQNSTEGCAACAYTDTVDPAAVPNMPSSKTPSPCYKQEYSIKKSSKCETGHKIPSETQKVIC
jgi:hypothetical protein